MTAGPTVHVKDVLEDGFDAEVLARSHEVPVVVDFWAPWCGPCRVLGPVLEREVAALGGRVELAKVNTDAAPSLSAQYEIRGIPAVKAAWEGGVNAGGTDEGAPGPRPEYGASYYSAYLRDPDQNRVEIAVQSN